MSTRAKSLKKHVPELDQAARVALCQRWLALACAQLRQRVVMATQVRQARAAGLSEEEALLSVEPTQMEVGQATEALSFGRNQGIAQAHECIAFDQASDAVLGISRQGKVGVTAVHGVAQSAALVERQPPDIFNRAAQALADFLRQLDVQTFFRTFRLAKGQVVGV